MIFLAESLNGDMFGNIALLTIAFGEHIFDGCNMIFFDDKAENAHSEKSKNEYSQKVESGMDALWDSGKWSDEKNEEILKEHLRTPYKGKVP